MSCGWVIVLYDILRLAIGDWVLPAGGHCIHNPYIFFLVHKICSLHHLYPSFTCWEFSLPVGWGNSGRNNQVLRDFEHEFAMEGQP